MIAMRIFRGTVALSAMLLLFSSFAEAQPPRGGQRGGFGFGGGGFMGPPGGFTLDRAILLGSRQVREELKIEDAQAATIEAALEAYRDERRSARPDFQAMRDMSESERAEFGEKMRKEAEALSKKTDEMLNALLEPAQQERLDQISLQARLSGREVVRTLKEDGLKNKLGIAEDQLAKLTAVEEKTEKKQQELRQSAFQGGGGGGDREAMRERFEKMRTDGEKITKELHSEAMAILTQEQLATLETLKGTAFELDMRSLMGGRGGIGGPPGGPGVGAGRGDGGRGRGDGAGRGDGGRGRGDGAGRGDGGRGRGDGGGRQRPQSDDSI